MPIQYQLAGYAKQYGGGGYQTIDITRNTRAELDSEIRSIDRKYSGWDVKYDIKEIG